MPKSAAQKKKRAAKRQAKRAEAKVLHKVDTVALGGQGRYKARARKITGSGSYVSDIVDKVSAVGNYAPRTVVGKAAKAAVESGLRAAGIPFASQLGSAASWLTRLAGHGSYTKFGVKRNSFVAGSESGFMTNPSPTFTSAGGPSLRLRHDEYVMDITSSANFSATTLALNPGNPIAFPWGHQIARLFEEYHMHGLVFEFRPTSAMAVGTTSSAMGVVVQATDYNAYDTNFTDKRHMENALFATSGMPYQCRMHPIECAKTLEPTSVLYVQPELTDASTAPGDARLSVMGNYTIATQGQQTDGTIIGELWIHYDLELTRPLLEDSANSFAQHVIGDMTYGASGAVMRNTLVSTGFSVTVDYTQGCLILEPSSFTPEGEYMFNLIVQVANAAPAGGMSLNPHYPNTVVGATYVDGLVDNSGNINVNPFTYTTIPAVVSYPAQLQSSMLLYVSPTTTQIVISLPTGRDATSGAQVTAYWDLYVNGFNPTYNARSERNYAKQRGPASTDLDIIRNQIMMLQKQLKKVSESESSTAVRNNSVDEATSSSSDAAKAASRDVTYNKVSYLSKSYAAAARAVAGKDEDSPLEPQPGTPQPHIGEADHDDPTVVASFPTVKVEVHPKTAKLPIGWPAKSPLMQVDKKPS